MDKETIGATTHTTTTTTTSSSSVRSFGKSASSSRIKATPTSDDHSSTANFGSETWISLLGLIDFKECFVTIDQTSLWQSHIAWANKGKDIREYHTKRFASNMVFLSLLLGSTMMALCNSAHFASDIRLALKGEHYNSLNYWIGCVLISGAGTMVLGLISTYTCWGMISAISDTNAHAILRSRMGQYATRLPSRFVVAALYLFIAWILLLITDLVKGPTRYIMMGLLLGVFFQIIVSLSAFGRLIIHTGAMGTKRILDPELERQLLPSGLHASLLIKATEQRRRAGRTAHAQYNNTTSASSTSPTNNNKTGDGSFHSKSSSSRSMRSKKGSNRRMDSWVNSTASTSLRSTTTTTEDSIRSTASMAPTLLPTNYQAPESSLATPTPQQQQQQHPLTNETAPTMTTTTTTTTTGPLTTALQQQQQPQQQSSSSLPSYQSMDSSTTSSTLPSGLPPSRSSQIPRAGSSFRSRSNSGGRGRSTTTTSTTSTSSSGDGGTDSLRFRSLPPSSSSGSTKLDTPAGTQDSESTTTTNPSMTSAHNGSVEPTTGFAATSTSTTTSPILPSPPLSMPSRPPASLTRRVSVESVTTTASDEVDDFVFQIRFPRASVLNRAGDSHNVLKHFMNMKLFDAEDVSEFLEEDEREEEEEEDFETERGNSTSTLPEESNQHNHNRTTITANHNHYNASHPATGHSRPPPTTGVRATGGRTNRTAQEEITRNSIKLMMGPHLNLDLLEQEWANEDDVRDVYSVEPPVPVWDDNEEEDEDDGDGDIHDDDDDHESVDGQPSRRRVRLRDRRRVRAMRTSILDTLGNLRLLPSKRGAPKDHHRQLSNGNDAWDGQELSSSLHFIEERGGSFDSDDMEDDNNNTLGDVEAPPPALQSKSSSLGSIGTTRDESSQHQPSTDTTPLLS